MTASGMSMSVGALLMVWVCACASGARAQAVEQHPGQAESPQPQPKPDINLIVIDSIHHMATETFRREDLREVPPAKVDRLSDSIRVTVTVGDPRCAPGEDGWEGPARPRSRTSRPNR